MLVIDQGSKSTYAYIFKDKRLLCKTQRTHVLTQSLPGQAEFDPDEIFSNVLLCMADLAKQLLQLHVPIRDIETAAITCQRDSLVVFDSDYLIAHCGISWLDQQCQVLLREVQPAFNAIFPEGVLSSTVTGLKYLYWQKANNFAPTRSTVIGTMETYLLYKLNQTLKSEVSLASRIGFVKNGQFDAGLMKLFNIPQQQREICRSLHNYGRIQQGPFKDAQIQLIVGDSNAGLLGCKDGEMCVSLGVGAFVLSSRRVDNSAKIVLFDDAEAYEAELHDSAAVVDWLLSIGVLDDLSEVEQLLLQFQDSNQLFISSLLRVITGVSQSCEKGHFVRAAVEGAALDLFSIIGKETVKVSGGLSRKDEFCQILADLTGHEVVRVPQMTARGCYIALCGELSEQYDVFQPSTRDLTQQVKRWQKVQQFVRE